MIPLFLTTVFFVLGILHLSWALGNSWGFASSLPTKETGERVLNPKRIDSAIVGLALLAFGLFYGIKTDYLTFQLPNWISSFANWFIPSLFLFRAIGDFNYIGLFRKVKKTTFEKLDRTFFTPLCILISTLGFSLYL